MPTSLSAILSVSLMVMATNAVILASDPGANVSPERAKELEARKQSIERQIAELEALQKRKVPEETRAELNEKLAEIVKNKGYNDANGGVFQNALVEMMMNNERMAGNPSALVALKAFSEQLAERNVDLIVVPVDAAPRLHAHKLLPGKISPGDDVWPAYTEGLLELLRAGIEVVDPATAYTEKLVRDGVDSMWNYDHHWSSDGILVAADLIAERLKRYDFVQQADQERARFSMKEIEIPTPAQILVHNKIITSDEWKKNINNPEALGVPATSKGYQVLRDGQVYDSAKMFPPNDRIDPILFMGDSNVGHLTSLSANTKIIGCGMPEHLSRLTGWDIARRDEANGGNIAPRRYADRFSKQTPQPRVLILATTRGSLLRDWQVVRFPGADDSATIPSAQFVSTDTTTLGNWQGKFGKDGYYIVGEKSATPDYVNFHGEPQIFPAVNEHFYKYAEAGNGPQGFSMQELVAFPKGKNPPESRKDLFLKIPEANGGGVAGTTWVNHKGSRMAIDVKFQDAREHLITLYLSDYGGHKNVLKVQVLDLKTGKALTEPEEVNVANSAAYVTFRAKGHIRFVVEKVSGGGPQVSGFFFDPVPDDGGQTAAAAPAKIKAKAKFLSRVPDPSTAVYKDALTTGIFTVTESSSPNLPVGTDFFAVQWIMKDAKLLPSASLKVGDEKEFTAQAWDDVVKADRSLETLQRVDDTTFDAAMPFFFLAGKDAPAN